MADLTNWGQHGTLRDDRPYGQHIDLTCVHHPHLLWNTKNIAPIGARNIFFKGISRDLTEEEYTNLPKEGKWSTECSCPCSDLIVKQSKS